MMTAGGRVDTVAVVGAAAGVGAAAARRLTSDGYRVITVDVRDTDITCDLGTDAGRRAAVAGVTRLAHGILDGLVLIPRAEGPETSAAVVSLHYFGRVALLEGLRPALARSGHAVAVVGTTSSGAPPGWPVDLERLCFAGDEGRARRLAEATGVASAHGASTAALARYVRRRALTPGWIGAAVRLCAVASGDIAPLRLGDDLNDDGAIRDLERFRAVAEAVAARITFLFGPEARALWRSALDGGAPDAVGFEPAEAGRLVATQAACPRGHPRGRTLPMSRRAWIGSILLLGALIATGGLLAAWKHASLQRPPLGSERPSWARRVRTTAGSCTKTRAPAAGPARHSSALERFHLENTDA